MKQLCKFIVALLSVFLLAACGKQTDREPPAGEGKEQTENAETESAEEKNSTNQDNMDQDNTQTQEADGTMEHDIAFDFETKTVTLNSGYEMPIYGIGTYSLTDGECVDSVITAGKRRPSH